LENGALLYAPASRQSRLLCPPPPPSFAAALSVAGVEPLSCGEAIIATWHPHEQVVLDTIRRTGADLQVIFNKGAVMILPSGVNKASGLAAALDELGLSAHNLAGIGDAENDLPFLKMCACSIAVANALPAVKSACDLTTAGDHGRGVEEAAELIISGKLEQMVSGLERHQVPLGSDLNGKEVNFSAASTNVLLAGKSGAGKSSIATGLVQRLAQAGYQFCLIDPEGDHESLSAAVVLGTEHRPPELDEAINVLRKPARNLVLNLVGLGLDDRPAFFAGLMPRISELRASHGCPHWLLVDEAHHILPVPGDGQECALASMAANVILITVEPAQLDSRALRLMKRLIVVGASAKETIAQFCQAAGIHLAEFDQLDTPADDEALFWPIDSAPMRIKPLLGERESRRHRRKYAKGELGPEHSFYFRGADLKLNLRAHNLQAFVRLAKGLDDATWLFHLRRGDYSRWFTDIIKDSELAQEARKVERADSISPEKSRKLILDAIEQRYTAPAEAESIK
jgi:haloacid dehalogenase-like hydrolase/CobQ/CobB/MinD/ParA nucleotide binding domain